MEKTLKPILLLFLFLTVSTGMKAQSEITEEALQKADSLLIEKYKREQLRVQRLQKEHPEWKDSLRAVSRQLQKNFMDEIIDTELQLKDLETIESRIQKVQKQAQTGGDKTAKQIYEVLLQYKTALEQGKSARTVQFETKDEQKIAKELFLLTAKPVLYVCNVDEQSAVSGNKYVEMVREAIREENAELLVVAAKTEADIAELETYEDRQMFLQEIGLEESGVSRLIKSAYHLLNLETFITAGEMEVKAWTYHKGWKAPQCAGVIHTDFEKGFIRAEVSGTGRRHHAFPLQRVTDIQTQTNAYGQPDELYLVDSRPGVILPRRVQHTLLFAYVGHRIGIRLLLCPLAVQGPTDT